MQREVSKSRVRSLQIYDLSLTTTLEPSNNLAARSHIAIYRPLELEGATIFFSPDDTLQLLW